MTIPPGLPELKAWFCTDSLGHLDTITDFKAVLCSYIQVLKDAGVQHSNVVLLLDDFELLNESSVHVVRDGDLICIKPSCTHSSNQHKTPESINIPHTTCSRRTSINIPKSSLHRPDQSLKRKLSFSSRSESDTGSEETSSTSISASPSSIASKSPSSSSIISQPHDKLLTASYGNSKPTSAPPLPHIPPGCGKPTTQRRNLRRRLKKWYDKSDQQGSVGIRKDNTQLFGLKCSSTETHPASTPSHSNPEPAIFMSSLRNKNKKKGFKNAMTKLFPQKIVFSTGHTSDSVPPSSADVNNAESTCNRTLNDSSRCLITPSEKQDRSELPHNIFVTSVDVEAEMMGRHKPKWESNVLADGLLDANNEKAVGQGSPSYEERTPIESNWIGDASRTSDWGDYSQLDVNHVQERWETFTEITEISQLTSGQTVCWKILTINPATLTPEVLPTIVRVLRCDSQTIVVQPLYQPGAAQLSFGGTLEFSEGIEAEQMEYTWPDPVEQKWRLLLM